MLLEAAVEVEASDDVDEEQHRRSWRRRAQSSPPLARSSECGEKATLSTLSPCGAARRHSRGAGGDMRVSKERIEKTQNSHSNLFFF